MKTIYSSSSELGKNKHIFWASIAFAFFTDVKCLTSVFSAFNITSEGSSIMSLFYIFIVGVIYFLSLKDKQSFFASLGRAKIIVLSYIIFSFLFTTTFLIPPLVSLNYFLVFTVAAFCIPSLLTINSKTYIEWVVLLPILGILRLEKIFAPEFDVDEGNISMGQSYAFLIPILACLLYLKFYFRDESDKFKKAIMVVATIVNCIYLFQLLLFGSRGPIVCILAFVLFFYIFPFKKGKGVYLNKRFSLVILIFLVLSYVFFKNILFFISDLLNSYDINVIAIDKLISLYNSGDVSNGRDFVYAASLDGFYSNPFFGLGLDQFFYNTGEPYPHNSILQIMYDGGLLFVIILLFPFVKGIFDIYKSANRDKYVLVTFFLFAGFFSSMFSDNLWMQPIFWLCMGVVLTKKNIIANVS